MAAFFAQGISADKKTDQIAFNLNISRQELAKIVGVTPETMSRVVKKMVEKGLIAVHGRDIQILKPELLDKLSSGELRLDMVNVDF